MKYNIQVEKKEKSVAVITPTIGGKGLKAATGSVENQTYKKLHHYVVIDGKEYFEEVFNNASLKHGSDSNISFHVAPTQTGKNGFYGHRIYAAYPHMLDEDYILFLDDDNWWEPDHVESLVNLIEDEGLSWAHSLRNVWLDKDTFLDKDCCESIGRWPIHFTQDKEQKDYLVDTSSFCFRREFLIHVTHLWHWGWGGDRRFFKIIKDNPAAKYNTTGKHTLNYILPDMNTAYGGDFNFFKEGNESVQNFYGGKYPWIK